MRDPSFWWQPPGTAAALLSPVAMFYGLVAGARLSKRGRSFGVPVICIGNLTVGGAGKTPTAMTVARLLLAAGKRVFFLTRGYGGEIAGPVRVDPIEHRAYDVGDEALLLAQWAPTIVAQDRVAGAEAACKSGAEVIVMDDGFQNPSLAKDLSILVIDGRRGIGNGKIFPAGPLRAPLMAQLDRAHALLVVGDVTGAEPVVSAAISRRLPIFHGRFVPAPKALEALSPHKLFAFAGIGDPEKFFDTLHDARLDVEICDAFPDHHSYRGADILALMVRAEREGLVLVTTEKDYVRLQGNPDADALMNVLRVLPVTLAIEEIDDFRNLLLNAAGPAISPARS